MKTLASFLLIIASVIVLVAWTYKTPPTIDLTVFRDVTDTQQAKPEAAEIFSLVDLSGDNKWNGLNFRFSDVSDVSYNRISETGIEPANKWFGNEMLRDRGIQKTKDKISKIIADAEEEKIGKEHSAVYFPIATELVRLSQSKAERKILIVYSDLMENDLDFSLYSKQELELLKANPDSLKEIFEKRLALPSLQGIEVYLIYQPNNAIEDKDYRLVSDFYSSLLEDKGASIHISANLIN